MKKNGSEDSGVPPKAHAQGPLWNLFISTRLVTLEGRAPQGRSWTFTFPSLSSPHFLPGCHKEVNIPAPPHSLHQCALSHHCPETPQSRSRGLKPLPADFVQCSVTAMEIPRPRCSPCSLGDCSSIPSAPITACTVPACLPATCSPL